MQRRSKYEKANMKVRIAQAENFVAQWEIAEEVGISRQAVHEALNHATDRLFRLEAQLGVAERFRRMQAGLEDALDALNHHEDEQARQLIEALLALDQEDPDGI